MTDGSTRAAEAVAPDAGARYGRILLKLSGEALMGDQGFGLHPPTVERIAAEVKSVHDLGVEALPQVVAEDLDGLLVGEGRAAGEIGHHRHVVLHHRHQPGGQRREIRRAFDPHDAVAADDLAVSTHLLD